MAHGPALDAFWLPDAGRVETAERGFGPGRVPLRVPALSPRTLRKLLDELRARRERFLAERPVRSILERVGAAAARLTDPVGPLHVEILANLPALTGYSREMIALGLERMRAGWTADALGAVLAGELGELDVLDGFRPRGTGGSTAASGSQRAYGPALCVHVFSGNIPGVSVSSLIRALCVKSASFGKLAAGEPYLAVCFARALAAVDPELASCLAITHWPGGSEDLEAVAFSAADAVIAYGSDETIASVACRVPPTTRFLSYPNRVGAALISRRALAAGSVDELAERAARDVVVFDQQGCVSPHVLYVESGGEIGPDELARRVAAALDRLTRELPRGAVTPGESALIHQVRAQAEMRAATVMAGPRGTEWTVILEERAAFEPSPLNRVIRIRVVASLSEAIAALRPVGRRLQTVSVAMGPNELDDLAGELGAIGATRIVPVGDAAWPAPNWHHDGRFQYLDLLRFVDREG